MSNTGDKKAQHKEAAKLRRQQEMRRKSRARWIRRARNWGIVIVVVGLIAGYLVFNAQKSKKANAALSAAVAAAGCSQLQSPSALGREHIADTETFKYNSSPPTSGNHWKSPGPTGVVTQPVPDERQVHNLEHGHAGIQYNGINADLIDKLAAVVNGDPTKIFMAPRPALEKNQVAFTSWGHLLVCSNASDKVVAVAQAFVKRFAGSGPEGFIPRTSA